MSLKTWGIDFFTGFSLTAAKLEESPVQVDDSQVSRVLPQGNLNIDQYVGINTSVGDSREIQSRLLVA